MWSHSIFLYTLYKQKKCKYRANHLDDNKSNYDLRIRPVVIFSQVVMNFKIDIFKKRFKNIFTSPSPPSTINTAASRM
jgi:hypothetical protein